MGNRPDLELQGEAKGILFSEKTFGPVEQATTAFGQGISVTPIQQVQAVAAAINGGYLYRPYIVKEIKMIKGRPSNRLSQKCNAVSLVKKPLSK